MLELKVRDVRLRGCGFTLYPAAKENGIEEELVVFLVTAIYSKLGLCTGDYDKEQAIQNANPNILDTISTEDLSHSLSYKGYSAADLIKAGLVTQSGDNLTLTEKAVAILKRASEIQNKLDEEGFYCCPCGREF